MPEFVCKCYEGRAGSFLLVMVPHTTSCSQRVFQSILILEELWLEEEKLQCLSLVASSAQAMPGVQGWEVQWRKDSSHRRSWPQTVAPDGISAGSILQQLSPKKWLRFSGPPLWLVDEMSQKGIEDRWYGQKGEKGWGEAKGRSWCRVTFQIICLGGNFWLIQLPLDIAIASWRETF